MFSLNQLRSIKPLKTVTGHVSWSMRQTLGMLTLVMHGVKMVEATAQIYTSTEEEYIQTNTQLLWQKLAKTPGTYIFKVSIISQDGEPQAKRRKKDAASTTSVELLLKAGVVEAEETLRPVMPQVRERMSKEVSQELARPKLSYHSCKVNSVHDTP